MNIRDFLQLQCTFKGDRIAIASPEIKEVLRIGEGAAEVLYLVVGLQHLRHQLRDVA